MRGPARLLAMALLAGATPLGAQAASPPIIPAPAMVEAGQGRFTLSDGAVIAPPPGDAQARFAAQDAAGLIAKLRGLTLKVEPGAARAAVRLRLDPTLATGPEGYRLEVTPGGVEIVGRDEAGLFYGLMSLVELASPAPGSGAVVLPAVSITDQPRFSWRGMHLDSARHFQSVGEIKRLLDLMALHKLNVFHWHLSDDQGFRLQIRRYPELTRIGAWRTPPSVGADDGHLPRYGGFYTQDEAREVVAYAKARHITVLPEFDMPGHAQAIVASYPDLGVTGTRPPVAVDYGVNPYLLRPDQKGLDFVHGLLDEVMAIFPSTYIHIGGDEAVKDQWKASPAVQAQMKRLGLKTEDELQSWFTQQVGLYLAAHGRRLIGWDEILEGGLPPTASIMSWRGAAGAVTAARAGHDVVLAPTTLYLDNLIALGPDAPPGRIGKSTLEDAYKVDVSPPGLSAEELRHVLGLQAAIWTEYIAGDRRVETAAYPRLAAAAEAAWSPQARRDYPDFLTRMPAEIARYRRLGVAAAPDPFTPVETIAGGKPAALKAGRATVSLATPTGLGVIRYTLDGVEPSPASSAYTAPLELPLGTTLKAAAFTPQGMRLGAVLTRSFSPLALATRSSAELKACPDQENGLRVPLNPDQSASSPAYDVDLFDSCWVYPAAPLDRAHALDISAARLPRNYGLAHDQSKVVTHPASTPYGELVVHGAGCAGPVLASFPLPDPKAMGDVHLRFSQALKPAAAPADLCLIVTAPITGALYALDTVSLVP